MAATENKLYIHIIKKDEENFVVAGLSEDKNLWFFYLKNTNLETHKILCTKPAIIGARKAIKPINGFRKIGLKLDDAVKKEYFDEDDNLSYRGAPLEEMEAVPSRNKNSTEFQKKDQTYYRKLRS